MITQVLGSIIRISFLTLMCACFFLEAAQATLRLPRELTSSDREEVLRIVGLGTSSKILSDPYPLGGFKGFEFGVSIENLATSDIGGLGAGLENPQQDMAYPKFTFGKGLFNDVDLFLHFTPYNRQDEVSLFGGIARWGFYQATNFPFSLSVLAHVNSGNFSNQMTTKSYGLDFIGGVNVRNVSVFAGGGPVQATGTFIGTAEGITDTDLKEDAFVSGFHTVVGANIHLSNFFFTAQMDRYESQVFSGKLGLRF